MWILWPCFLWNFAYVLQKSIKAEAVIIQTGVWEVAGYGLSLGTANPCSDFLYWFTTLLLHKCWTSAFKINIICRVSVMSWSLVQRSPTDCGALLCVIKKPRGWGGHSPRCAAVPEKIIIIIIVICRLGVPTFHWHNPSCSTMALGLTQPLTEMSTSNISWGIKETST
jgi:hypothetical protein